MGNTQHTAQEEFAQHGGMVHKGRGRTALLHSALPVSGRRPGRRAALAEKEVVADALVGGVAAREHRRQREACGWLDGTETAAALRKGVAALARQCAERQRLLECAARRRRKLACTRMRDLDRACSCGP